MDLGLFISHSFDHPDKLLRIQEFIHRRAIRHIDHSIPSWDPYEGPDVQAEIKRRIRSCDRVIVILTDGIEDSPWIVQELKWASHYDKPVIAVWPHGDAGGAVPEFVADTYPQFIGWRATSLDKALHLEDAGTYKAINLAHESERDRLIRQLALAGGVLSVLLVGHDILRLRLLYRDLQAQGYKISFPQKIDPKLLIETALHATFGGLCGCILGELLGTSKKTQRHLAATGSIIGGALHLHRQLRVEFAVLGPLAQLYVSPTEPTGDL